MDQKDGREGLLGQGGRERAPRTGLKKAHIGSPSASSGSSTAGRATQ